MIYLILFAGLVIRLISLNQSLWLDEGTTALVSKMSLQDIFTKFLPGDFHPPLYYLLEKFWTTIFGYSEISLRIPSVIFGTITIYVIYLIGKKLLNEKLGLISSAFAAASGLLIYYSQEARMYSLSALLVCFAVYTFIQKKWLLFSISLMLVGMTDYVPLFIVPIFFISGFKDWKKVVLCFIPLAASYLLWFPIFIKQLIGGLIVNVTSPLWWQILGETSIKNLALIPTKFILGRISIDNLTVYIFVTVLLSLIFGILMAFSIEAKNKFRIVWLWLLVPLSISIVIGIKIPVLSYFRLIFILPAFYILIAGGILTLKKNLQVFFVIFILMVNLTTSAAYLSVNKFQREDWRGLVSFVESKKTESSVTIFVADSNMEAYRYYAQNAKIAGPEGIKPGYDQIWLMRYLTDVFDPGDKAKSQIEKLGYKNIGEYTFNEVGVWEYTR